MEKTVIVIGSAVVIGLIIWWFFGKRQGSVAVAEDQGDKQVAHITVSGGYQPGTIELKQGQPAELIFTRKDTSNCFEEVVLPDFGVSTHLPVDKPYTISINPEKPGEYTYSCGMHMFFGKIIVK